MVHKVTPSIIFLMDGHISMRLNLRSLDPHDCLGHQCGASWRLMAVYD